MGLSKMEHSVTELTAKIVQWDNQKGFGFLQSGNARVFLHRRELAEMHKRPEMGDVIRFTMGSDAKGRPCAQNAVHVNDGGRITPVALAMLVVLPALPLSAAYRLGLDMRWVAGVALGMSLWSYALYALDKRRARAKEWRIPEGFCT